MSLSYQEKSIWGSLIARLAVYGYYFAGVLRAPGTASFTSGRIAGIVSSVTLLVAIEVAYHLAMSAKWRPEPKDERDRLIEGQAYRIAYVCLVVGALTSMWSVIAGMTPFRGANLVFLSIVMSDIVKAVVQLACYRRGV